MWSSDGWRRDVDPPRCRSTESTEEDEDDLRSASPGGGLWVVTRRSEASDQRPQQLGQPAVLRLARTLPGCLALLPLLSNRGAWRRQVRACPWSRLPRTTTVPSIG